MKKNLVIGMLLCTFIAANAEITTNSERLSKVTRYRLFGGYGNRTESFADMETTKSTDNISSERLSRTTLYHLFGDYGNRNNF